MASQDTDYPIRSTDVPEDIEVILLRRKLEDHVHSCDTRNHEQDVKIEKLIIAQQQTTESINNLIASTQGLVDSWKFTQAIRKLVIWASAFTVPIGAAYTKLKGWW